MEGIENFRRVEDGWEGRLYRSGQLHAATAGDRAALVAIGVGLIVDLRRPAEQDAAPSPDLGIRTIASDLDDRAISPHLGFLESGDLRAEAIDAYLLGYYQAAPFSAPMRDLLKPLLDVLASSPTVALVHCVAGKDRTGIAIAIAQLAGGVSRDAVTTEFLRSNATLVDAEARERARQQILATTGREPPEHVIDAFTGVRAEHLQGALDAIDMAGGIDTYLASRGIHADDGKR